MDDARRFGVVMFDDDKDPGPGWAAVADPDARNIRPKRIQGHNELATDTVWWSNCSYETFFKSQSEPWRNANLRHDKFLPIGQPDVLKEWGYDPKTVEPDFVCTFGAQVFDRIMRIAWNLLSDVNPKQRIEMAFQGKTLREDLRPLLPELEYPRLEAAESFRSGAAWEEFTATGIKGPKGGRTVTLRKPRVSYAHEMMKTRLPKGPYEFENRADMRSKTKDRVAYVKEMAKTCPAMVEVSVQKIQGDVAPVYGFGAATSKDKRQGRSWVSALEFDVLSHVAEVDVKSLYRADHYWDLVPDLNEAVQAFLKDRYTNMSWSAGIVAESLWRTVALGELKGKTGFVPGSSAATTSWQGLWVRAADKTQMFRASLRLSELGYAVASYGTGWIRLNVGEEEMANVIRDGLAMGLVPSLSDVPDKFDPQFAWPKEDVVAKAFAQITVSKKSQVLWNFDKAPALPASERDAYLKRVIGKMTSGAEVRKAG